MTLESLEKLHDDELQAVIARAGELLKQHDRERKDKAMAEAGAIPAAAGLSLKDIARKGRGAKHGGGKGQAYHAGYRYQHPTNKALTWNAKGQKPGWLRQREAEGKTAVELPAA